MVQARSRWLGVAIVVAALVALWRRPPRTDAGRRARIERWSGALAIAFPDVPEVTADEVLARRARGEDVVLVDVRAPAERRVSTPPGAIDASTFMADPGRYAGSLVVACCTIGLRSLLWARVRRAEGHDVRSLHGGLLAWTHAGGKLVGSGAETKRVHVYASRYALARRDHEPTW